MDWKEFFRPGIWLLIILIITDLYLFFVPINNAFSAIPQPSNFQSVVALLSLMFILLSILYLLICFVVFIYSKFKK